MTSSRLTPAPCQWFSRLAALDRRSTLRLALLFLGAVLAWGRRCVGLSIRLAWETGAPTVVGTTGSRSPFDFDERSQLISSLNQCHINSCVNSHAAPG